MSTADFAGLESYRYIFAADFYIQGAETWDEVPGGLQHPEGRIVNVDHHAPLPSMQRHVTSTMLGAELVGGGPGPSMPRAHRPDPARDVVVVNHMDCDTLLSAGILSGRLEPEAELVEASVAADHTGVENDIADLLQGLDAQWSREKRPIPDAKGLFDFYEDLDRLLTGRPLSDFAQGALDARRRGREAADRLVRERRFQGDGGVVLGVLEEQVEGELFQPFLPDAAVIVIATRSKTLPRPWRIKIRLGPAAPEGLSLHDLRIKEDIDEYFGGRWNAGSNKAGGGTDLEPESYRQRIEEALGRWFDRG